MRLLDSVVGILVIHMNGFRDHLPAGYSIATQFVSHNLPGFATVTTQQSLEEPLGRRTISASLKVYIHDIPALIGSPPQIMLLAIDLHEDFIDVECVAVALVSALQSTGVIGPKLDAPESDGLMADCDTTFGQDIFDITVAQIESVVEPDSMTDDIWRKSMANVSIRGQILAEKAG